ncbi:MAG: NYN domain-containing protein, partial [Acidimicrobiia bacterium]|nr:NYN domain-containing protein [Acidimicrobiia bacterium]
RRDGAGRPHRRVARRGRAREDGRRCASSPRRRPDGQPDAAGRPGALATDPVRATEHLLRSSALVLVDGYNVAKLAWPDLDLQAQRERCLDAVDTIARRYGSEMAVIFDGADVVGSHAPTRRLARVRYSPTGVIADDVIRAEVAGQPPERPIVVVTNDQAVRRDVAAAGANVVTSDIFIAVALG